jgi:hypothetical protein
MVLIIFPLALDASFRLDLPLTGMTHPFCEFCVILLYFRSQYKIIKHKP